MPIINDDIIIYGNRKGIILDADDKYYYVTYLYELRNGRYKPLLSEKIYKVSKVLV